MKYTCAQAHEQTRTEKHQSSRITEQPYYFLYTYARTHTYTHTHTMAALFMAASIRAILIIGHTLRPTNVNPTPATPIFF